MEYILPLALISLLLVREYQSHKERKDLYDRLMANDLPEYKEAQVVEEPTVEEEDEELIDIESAEKEITGEENGEEN